MSRRVLERWALIATGARRAVNWRVGLRWHHLLAARDHDPRRLEDRPSFRDLCILRRPSLLLFLLLLLALRCLLLRPRCGPRSAPVRAALRTTQVLEMVLDAFTGRRARS